MSDMISKKTVCLILTAVMFSAVSKAAVCAENVSVTADNLSVAEDGSVTADLTYNTDTADGYVIAAMYDGNQRFKSYKSQKIDSGKTLSITMSPTDTVETFIWQDLSHTLMPLADVVGYDKKGLYGTQKTEWTFDDGKNVDKNRNYADNSNPTEWTFGTAWYDLNEPDVDKRQQFYQEAYPVIKDVSGAVADTMSKELNLLRDSNYADRGGTEYNAPGSSKCMEFTVKRGQEGQLVAAIRVLLSKNQLQPGKKYKISMYTKNSVGTRAIYSTLQAPYKWYYNTGDNTLNAGTGDANMPWACKDKDASPVAYSNCYWTPYEFIVEPKPGDFDTAGYTNLWLAYTREFNDAQLSPGGVSSDGTTYSMDKFWIDDFKITEYQEHPLSWTFENESDDIGTGSVLGKWVSATSHKGSDDASSYMFPIVQSDIIPGTADAASTGPASNSTKCLKLSTKDQWCEKLSIKVKVSKDQLVPGKTYNLSMYAVSDANHKDANKHNSIYASLQPATTDKNKSFGLYHEANDQILPWVFTGRNNQNNATGRLNGFDYTKPYWSRYTTVLNPQDGDFDKNGYAYLWLTFTHSGFRAAGEIDKKITPSHDIYLDDISITERTEPTATTEPIATTAPTETPAPTEPTE